MTTAVENPFKDCMSVREVLDQLAGAASQCWKDSWYRDENGLEKVERVFDSNLAIHFSSHALYMVRELIIRGGGWFPDDAKAVKNATLQDSFGGYEGKTITQRIETVLEDAQKQHSEEVNRIARGLPEADHEQMLYLEGIKDGIQSALTILRGGSGVEDSL